MHHTLEWVNMKEKSKIQNSLSRNFDILLCGHNHHHEVSSTVSNIGQVIVNNTGCLYQSRDYFNGYSILSINTTSNKGHIHSREYYSDRDCFDVCTRFSSEGNLEIELLKKNSNNLPEIKGEVFDFINNVVSKKLLSASSDIAPKDISDMFVEPPMANVNEQTYFASKEFKDESEVVDSKKIEVTDLYDLKDNVLIYGKKEAGKTTLLNYLATQKYIEIHKNAVIGVVVDLDKAITSSGNINENSIIQFVIKFFDNEYNKDQVKNFLKQGVLLFCFDNFNIKSKNHKIVVEKFVSTYKKCRYICAVYEDNVNKLMSHGEKVTVDGFDKTIFIHSFKSTHTSELMDRWFETDPDSHSIYNNMVKKILRQLNIPSTPFLISALLWVFEQNMNRNLVNQASVVETLLDGLLDKLNESKNRKEYDSTIIIDFLTELAYHLDQIKVEFLSLEAFKLFTSEYFHSRSLFNPKEFIDDIVDKGIIFENNNCVGFKFDCFRSFYLAKKFYDNKSIWQKIIEEDRYTEYYSEFDIYTGINRNQDEVLTAFSHKCEEKFLLLDNIVLLNERIGSDNMLENIIEPMEDMPDKESFEAEVDNIEMPTTTSLDHDSSRIRKSLNSGNPISDFASALMIYSVCLRNGELINDPKLKSENLYKILNFWARILVSQLGEIDKIDIHTDLDSFEVKNVDYEEIKRHLPEIKSVLKTIFSISLFSTMNNHLATPKLQLVLESLINKKSEDINQEYVSIFALISLLESNTKQGLILISQNLKFLSSHKFILQILYFNIIRIYFFGDENESLDKHLKDTLAEIIIAIGGKHNNDAKNKIVQGLEKERRKISGENELLTIK